MVESCEDNGRQLDDGHILQRPAREIRYFICCAETSRMNVHLSVMACIAHRNEGQSTWPLGNRGKTAREFVILGRSISS